MKREIIIMGIFVVIGIASVLADVGIFSEKEKTDFEKKVYNFYYNLDNPQEVYCRADGGTEFYTVKDGECSGPD